MALEFYTQLPDEQVSLDWFEDFLAYLELAPKKLRSKYERPLNKIVKYEGVDKDAVIKQAWSSLRIIMMLQMFWLVFSFILNPYYEKASTVIDRYKDNLALLEDIYLKYLDLHGDEDQDGEFLAELFCRDPDFCTVIWIKHLTIWERLSMRIILGQVGCILSGTMRLFNRIQN